MLSHHYGPKPIRVSGSTCVELQVDAGTGTEQGKERDRDREGQRVRERERERNVSSPDNVLNSSRESRCLENGATLEPLS